MSEIKVNSVVNATGDNDSGIDLSTNDVIKFDIAGAEKARVDSSGNLLVGQTTASTENDGAGIRADGLIHGKRADVVATFNRKTSDGTVVQFNKDNSNVGTIFSNGGTYLGVGNDTVALLFLDDANDIRPWNASSNSARDNAIDLGNSDARFDDIFATNGTIQTSDQNEKNTITDSDLGLDFVNRLSPKSYIFNGKTRTHYGLIAQDVETVLSDISKETSEFAGFIKDDISEEQDGSQYRYGLRYTEFVGILIKALQEADDKIDALTARVTALESE